MSVAAAPRWLPVQGLESSWGRAVDRTVAATPVPGSRTPGTAKGRSAATAEESRAAGALVPWVVRDQVAGCIPQQPLGFQPRPRLLAKLNRAGRGVSVLTGMPGVGKTQLAAAYARAKLIAGWRLVAWVNAEDTTSLLAGLAAVAGVSGLSGGGSGQAAVDASQAVRHRLEVDGHHCLLVFDGAKDPDVLRPVIPAVGSAQVLITSTQQCVANLGTSIPVGVFSVDQALAILSGRTELADEDGAAALAAEVGYLPLALAQAAPVIAQQRLGYGEYLQQLRAQLVEDDLIQEEGQPLPPSVANVVSLSIEAIRTSDRTGVGAGVMEIIAVLSTCGVRRELLHAAGQTGVLAANGRRVPDDLVDQAVAGLAERSLLTPSMDGHTVTGHSLVMRVVCERLARTKRYPMVCRAAASALEARAEALAGSRDRPAVRDIPQQVMALLDSAAGAVVEPDRELARILLRLRFFALYHLIELDDSAPQAIAVGEPLIAELERLLGPDHPDTLNSQNSLATAYQATGRLAEAIPLFEQTLVGRERLLGPNHPDTLNSQNNLAATYQDAGRIAEAIPLFEQTLAARERLLGPDHPSAVNSRGNLAVAYQAAGRLAEAIPLFEQTLAARERVLGADHPDALRSRNNLANAYRKAGRVTDVIPLIEQVLAA
jgi:tetratricopeptide (TPR) repeat protein